MEKGDKNNSTQEYEFKDEEVLETEELNNSEDNFNSSFEEDFDKLDSKRNLIKRIGQTIMMLLVMVAVFLFVRAGIINKKIDEDTKKLETSLVSAGKEYFNINYDKAPETEGTCETVNLQNLILEKQIKKDKFKTCDGMDTYVQMCKLESGKTHFTPNLSCEQSKTKYEDWKEGNEEDLIKDKTDVKFEFTLSHLDTSKLEVKEPESYWEEDIPYDAYKTNETTEYYTFREKVYKWNLNTRRYYPNDSASASGGTYSRTSPGGEYKYKSNASAMYKWYKTNHKEYWNGGARSFIMPDYDYPKYDPSTGVKISVYRTREWNSVGVPTTSNPLHLYRCVFKQGSDIVLNSYTNCADRNDAFKIKIGEFYTCDTIDRVSANDKCRRCNNGGALRNDKTSCGSYSKWTDYTTKYCNDGSDTCQKNTKIAFKWYREVKSYYTDYSFTSPGSGYKRDTGKTTSTYKWYKMVKTGESDYSKIKPNPTATKSTKFKWNTWTDYSKEIPKASSNKQVKTKTKVNLSGYEGATKEDWKKVTKNYVEYDKIIKEAKKIKPNINSLEDIKLDGELEYKVKLYYRNRI